MSATQKLMHFDIDLELAQLLVENGFTTPRKIKEATKADLKKVTKFSAKKVDELKKKFDRG